MISAAGPFTSSNGLTLQINLVEQIIGPGTYHAY